MPNGCLYKVSFFSPYYQKVFFDVYQFVSQYYDSSLNVLKYQFLHAVLKLDARHVKSYRVRTVQLSVRAMDKSYCNASQ